MSLGFTMLKCYFLAFPFSPFLFFLLQLLTFCWACFQFKTFWQSSIETATFYLGVAKFAPSFSLNVLNFFVHFSGSIELWSGYNWKDFFPAAEVNHSLVIHWYKKVWVEGFIEFPWNYSFSATAGRSTGWYFSEFSVVLCHQGFQILTLFQPKHTISHTRFQTWGPFLESTGNVSGPRNQF